MADDGTDARTAVMGRIRRHLKVSDGPEDEARRAAVRSRLERHARNLVPARADGDDAHRLTLFKTMLERADATVTEVESPDEVPQAVAEFLRNHNLPFQIRTGADAALAALPWDRVPTLEVGHGPAEASDQASLSHAFAGIAETGTLALHSGQDNPTSLNFLPENHVVMVDADRVVGTYEDVWDRLREVFGEGVMPRALNMVTGPSRTGDIEQRLFLGAHGPKRVHVIIAGGGKDR